MASATRGWPLPGQPYATVSNAEYLAFVQAGGYEAPAWWDDEGRGWPPACQRPPTFWVRRPPRAVAAAADDPSRSPCPWDWPGGGEPVGGRRLLPLEGGSDQPARPAATERGGEDAATGNNWPAISRTGWRPPATSTWPLRLLLPGGCHLPQGSFFDLVGGTSGSGPAPPSVASGVPGASPLRRLLPPPPSTPSTPSSGAGAGSAPATGHSSPLPLRLPSPLLPSTRASLLPGLTPSGAVIVNRYETGTLVAQYLDFQYGSEPLRGRQLRRRLWPVLPARLYVAAKDQALDISCATMLRGSFELARPLRPWTGWTTRPFIDVALTLDQDCFRYAQLPVEGIWWNIAGARLSRRARSRAGASGSIQPGDACSLRAQVRRLRPGARLQPHPRPAAEPARFLQDIAPRAFAAAACWCSPAPTPWLTDYTPRPTGSAASGKTARPSAPIRRCNGCWRRSSRSTCPEGRPLRHPRDRPQKVPAHGGSSPPVWRKR